METRDSRALAHKLYGQCRESANAYKLLASSIRDLRNALEEAEEVLEAGIALGSYESGIEEQVTVCHRLLVQLNKAIEKHSGDAGVRPDEAAVAEIKTAFDVASHELSVACEALGTPATNGLRPINHRALLGSMMMHSISVTDFSNTDRTPSTSSSRCSIVDSDTTSKAGTSVTSYSPCNQDSPLKSIANKHIVPLLSANDRKPSVWQSIFELDPLSIPFEEANAYILGHEEGVVQKVHELPATADIVASPEQFELTAELPGESRTMERNGESGSDVQVAGVDSKRSSQSTSSPGRRKTVLIDPPVTEPSTRGTDRFSFEEAFSRTSTTTQGAGIEQSQIREDGDHPDESILLTESTQSTRERPPIPLPPPPGRAPPPPPSRRHRLRGSISQFLKVSPSRDSVIETTEDTGNAPSRPTSQPSKTFQRAFAASAGSLYPVASVAPVGKRKPMPRTRSYTPTPNLLNDLLAQMKPKTPEPLAEEREDEVSSNSEHSGAIGSLPVSPRTIPPQMTLEVPPALPPRPARSMHIRAPSADIRGPPVPPKDSSTSISITLAQTLVAAQSHRLSASRSQSCDDMRGTAGHRSTLFKPYPSAAWCRHSAPGPPIPAKPPRPVEAPAGTQIVEYYAGE
ncbi:hypothetical protein LTR86_008082 [Recurvomyces mirabilis]|nr:hypothetical protein LTR86_008082 [Recurvomyces mirabilis]